MNKMRKKLYLLIALIMVFALSIPIGVQAVMNSTTNKEENTFYGAYVDTAVIENGKQHESSDNNLEDYKNLKNTGDQVEKIVTIKNIASISKGANMYTRVRLIPSIVNDDAAKGDVLGGDINITYTFAKGTSWKVKDGVYYYSKVVEPGKESDVLLTNVKIGQNIPSGYHLELKVVSDSIATRPDTVLMEAWGIANFDDMSSVN